MIGESIFDWVIYGISILIFASALIEGKTTRYPALFFYGSLILMLILIVAGCLNWWFYRSKYGAVIVIFTVVSLLMTRFRLVIYKLRLRKLVSEIRFRIKTGFRIILVLSDNEDERNVLLSMLSNVLPEQTLIHTRDALGPHSEPILKALELHHQQGTGYILVCEQQISARTWLSIVENGKPDTSIAVNFHSIPEME
ncbi:hypothetical protein N8S78_21980 [Enterobacter hormaechei subsp. hoffmannii]|nr:hypothetical protein [Enterobacter hormaechei subsp. hoffmannii]